MRTAIVRVSTSIGSQEWDVEVDDDTDLEAMEMEEEANFISSIMVTCEWSEEQE